MLNGKGGKGGKGGKIGKSISKSAMRHRHALKDNFKTGLTNPAVRRIARRGGVKRISTGTYEELRGVLKIWLTNVIRDALAYVDHRHQKTITAMDIVYALKRQGITLYGFDGNDQKKVWAKWEHIRRFD